MDPQLIYALVAVFGSSGAAWIGVKVSLNGTRQRVTRIEKKVDNMGEKLDTVNERTARLEERVRVA